VLKAKDTTEGIVLLRQKTALSLGTRPIIDSVTGTKAQHLDAHVVVS
jgi:hypothetical protein